MDTIKDGPFGPGCRSCTKGTPSESISSHGPRRMQLESRSLRAPSPYPRRAALALHVRPEYGHAAGRWPGLRRLRPAYRIRRAIDLISRNDLDCAPLLAKTRRGSGAEPPPTPRALIYAALPPCARTNVGIGPSVQQSATSATRVALIGTQVARAGDTGGQGHSTVGYDRDARPFGKWARARELRGGGDVRAGGPTIVHAISSSESSCP